MTSCYLMEFKYVRGNEEQRVAEIEALNPDILIALCLEEFDYHYIFSKFFELIQPYLIRANKKIKLIAPYIDSRPLPKTIQVEDSYGYYHWTTRLIEKCIEDDIKFKFSDNTKLFTNYNNNGKYQRNMLVDEFAKHDLLKDGIVTLLQPKVYISNGSLYEYKYYDGAILRDEPDFVLNEKYEYNAGHLPKSYLNGFIDIVSESTYGTGEFFITEKTAKPIGSLKPFLVFGPPLVHKHLNERYNLKYYTELFDYSFDEEHDIQKRIDGIVKNLIRLRETPINKLIEIHSAITDKMICNRNNYLGIREDINRLTPKSLSFLNTNNSIKLYGDSNASILMSMRSKFK